MLNLVSIPKGGWRVFYLYIIKAKKVGWDMNKLLSHKKLMASF